MKIFQVLVLIFGLTVLANAQKRERTTILTGNIYDEMGAAISKANVKFRGTDSKYRVVTTNEDGEYIVDLENGSYSIEIEAVGFKTFKIQNYKIAQSYKGKMNFDVVLEVKSCDDPTVNCDFVTGEPVKTPKKNKVKKGNNK